MVYLQAPFQPRVDSSVSNVEAGLLFAVHSFFNERQDMRMATNSTSVKCKITFLIEIPSKQDARLNDGKDILASSHG
jgi:hypothetical protein